jgi:hypothetical protein
MNSHVGHELTHVPVPSFTITRQVPSFFLIFLATFMKLWVGFGQLKRFQEISSAPKIK